MFDTDMNTRLVCTLQRNHFNMQHKIVDNYLITNSYLFKSASISDPFTKVFFTNMGQIVRKLKSILLTKLLQGLH